MVCIAILCALVGLDLELGLGQGVLLCVFGLGIELGALWSGRLF